MIKEMEENSEDGLHKKQGFDLGQTLVVVHVP
jgi:hypothetical protein